MTVAASRRPGLVAPDIPAHVREARAFAQLGDVPRRLARLVGTREPLELVGTDHVIGHLASLEIVATSPGASVRECHQRDPRPHGVTVNGVSTSEIVLAHLKGVPVSAEENT